LAFDQAGASQDLFPACIGHAGIIHAFRPARFNVRPPPLTTASSVSSSELYLLIQNAGLILLRFKIDKTIFDVNGQLTPNCTRAEVFGSEDNSWIEMSVDPKSENVFSLEQVNLQ